MTKMEIPEVLTLMPEEAVLVGILLLALSVVAAAAAAVMAASAAAVVVSAVAVVVVVTWGLPAAASQPLESGELRDWMVVLAEELRLTLLAAVVPVKVVEAAMVLSYFGFSLKESK